MLGEAGVTFPPPPQVRFYAAELILALEHIHGQSMVYRDLKVWAHIEHKCSTML